MRILLVEDEPLLAERLGKGLGEESFAVDVAATVRQAAEMAAATDFDLVVLDLVLPDGSGLDLLADWRRHGNPTPVLVLTARDRLEDKLRGFELGADDYLTKPFSFDELLARVRSLLRRRGAPPRDLVGWDRLTLDRTRRQVEWDGREVELTPREFALLEHLMLRQGVVQQRHQIAEHVWDGTYRARSNVIDVLVGRLRRKLMAAGAPRPIDAIKGVGYVLRRPGRGGDDA